MIQYIFPPACVIFSFSSASYSFTSLDVVHFGLILLGTLCASWIGICISFPRFIKFSAIIFANTFSLPFSCLLLGPFIMQMLVLLMLSPWSLILFPFIFVHLFSVQLQQFPPICLPACWSIPLYHPILIASKVFTSQFFFFFSSNWFFIHFPKLFVKNFKLPTLFIQSFPKFFEHLIIIILNCFLGRLLISTSLSSGTLSCSFVWNIFSISTFCLHNLLFLLPCIW